MGIRDTEEYKKMDTYLACAYAEGFCEGEDASEEEQLAAWQYIRDNELYLHLQGFYGRTLFAPANQFGEGGGLVTQGIIE